jgi:DNA repair exonuclease SbcCD ATPase subunit
LSPKFGFFKRKTSDLLHDRAQDSDAIQSVTTKELSEILDKEMKILESDLAASVEPVRNSVLECLIRLRKGADDLEKQEIKIENPKFEPLINTSKNVLITSIRKESLIESSEIKSYEEAVRFKNNLELLINRFGHVGDSHNRILNEFMHKELNRLKSEFDNLSSLLKAVTKTLSKKDAEINECIQCKNDLELFMEKVNERRDKQNRLGELMEEKQDIEKNIQTGKRENEDFRKSEVFLTTSSTLNKINVKKNEIATFEKNIGHLFSSISRPITKFSYNASRETQGILATMQNKPLEIFKDTSQYLQVLNELRKNVAENSIQIKDPEKTIHQIDEIVKSIPSLSSSIKNLKEELTGLESSVNSKNVSHLEDIKSMTEMYEKYYTENVSNIENTKRSIDELDASIRTLKTKVEDKAEHFANRKFTIMQPQE